MAGEKRFSLEGHPKRVPVGLRQQGGSHGRADCRSEDLPSGNVKMVRDSYRKLKLLNDQRVPMIIVNTS